MGESLAIEWKCFSLEHAHSENGLDSKRWDHPNRQSRSLTALRAAKCAQLQGDRVFEAFHLLVYESFHRKKRDTEREEVLREIAGEAHLDTEQFMEDLRDRDSWMRVYQDHREAVEQYRVFGVPTLVLHKQWPFFLKLGSLPDSSDEQVALFREINGLVKNRPCLLEMKRT